MLLQYYITNVVMSRAMGKGDGDGRLKNAGGSPRTAPVNRRYDRECGKAGGGDKAQGQAAEGGDGSPKYFGQRCVASQAEARQIGGQSGRKLNRGVNSVLLQRQ